MEPFNFNELPEVIRLLFEKVELIEKVVINLQPAETTDNDLLNVEEAADFLKISTASLYTKVSRKELPYSKPGKRLYFKRSELQEWISSAQYKTSASLSSDASGFRSQPNFRRAERYRGS
ncbi:helix-turn-helix domain-containing protein [Mucilaginibacter lutimaris]|uniref:Helix-turn-helix domain-containing protein n=1 Tax=Mucilaginibacter lutimaris TaxID=931629 RepID=A0ABW2ZE54_9SPHI